MLLLSSSCLGFFSDMFDTTGVISFFGTRKYFTHHIRLSPHHHSLEEGIVWSKALNLYVLRRKNVDDRFSRLPELTLARSIFSPLPPTHHNTAAPLYTTTKHFNATQPTTPQGRARRAIRPVRATRHIRVHTTSCEYPPDFDKTSLCTTSFDI